MADTAHELEWLSDYVVSMLKSPTWVTPIAQFIDERCEVFDDGEEHELLQTTVHNEYQQLVNDLFVSHLLEISVQPEDFQRFCEHGLAGQTRLHRALVEQLLCVDDFLAFKAMMAKHNADLCREAITCETAEDDGEGEGPEPVSPTVLVANGVVASSIAEGLKNRDAEWQLYDDNLSRAMAESKTDQESLEAQLRCEEAALEQVIALSLQLEEERLRQIVHQEEPILPPPSPEPTLIETPAPPLVMPAGAGTLSSPLCFVPPKLKQPPAPKMVEVEPIMPARPRGGAWGFTSAPLCPAPPQIYYPDPTPAPCAVEPAPSAPAQTVMMPSVVGFTSSPLCYRPPQPKPTPRCNADGAPVEVAPVPAVPHQPVQKQPTLELDGMRSNLDAWRERATRAFDAKRPSALSVKRNITPAPAPASGPTDEERRQRAEHLARQRDRLRAKRQRDREQQMEAFRRSRGGAAHSSSLDRTAAQAANAAEGRRLVAALSPGAVVASPAAPPLQNAAAAAERMRQALTLQLRQTLMRTTVSDAGMLDGQLSQLELLRKSN